MLKDEIENKRIEDKNKKKKKKLLPSLFIWTVKGCHPTHLNVSGTSYPNFVLIWCCQPIKGDLKLANEKKKKRNQSLTHKKYQKLIIITRGRAFLYGKLMSQLAKCQQV